MTAITTLTLNML